MKIHLVLTLLVCISFVSYALDEKLKNYIKLYREASRPHQAGCIKESNITTEHLKQYAAGNLDIGKNFYCYLRCVATRSRTIKEDGNLDVEMVKQQLKLDETPFVEGLRRECSKPTSEDLCESVHVMLKCFKTVMEKYN